MDRQQNETVCDTLPAWAYRAIHFQLGRIVAACRIQTVSRQLQTECNMSLSQIANGGQGKAKTVQYSRVDKHIQESALPSVAMPFKNRSFPN
jgi:hypothetical protein